MQTIDSRSYQIHELTNWPDQWGSEMQLYETKYFYYSGGSVSKFLLKDFSELILAIEYVSKDTVDVAIECWSNYFRVQFNLEDKVLKVTRVVPCIKCRSINVNIFFNHLNKESITKAKCLDCNHEFDENQEISRL